MTKENLRPCVINSKEGSKPGHFHRWIDYAQVIAPGNAIGSYPGGQLMETRAIVELDDGTIETPMPYKVKFTDREDAGAAMKRLAATRGIPIKGGEGA